MSSRPRRSAATRANEVISVHARMADSPERNERSERSMSSRRSGRASGVSVSRDGRSSPGGDRHLSLTVKMPSNKLRQATRGGRGFEGGEIVSGKRNRGAKKSYVVDSSPDEDEEEEEEAEIEVEEDDDDEMEEDAEGEEDMDVDAEGEDAEGDIDMDLAPPPPTITVSKPSRSKPAPRASASKVVPDDDDDDDDLSDPADSDAGDETMGFGDETMADEDAEGEEIEVAGQEGDEEEEEEEEADSDDEGSQDESPDLTKMTKRQRARFEDEPQQYMKLSDEVQAKKVFTAEELSMRRQEMARRRRNLSEKRNEEVKMETINKLLKKQAPKVNRKAAGNGDGGDDSQKPNPAFIRWVSNKSGVRVAVTEEMLESPVGTIFGPAPKPVSRKLVEEV
ncbi:hypothetical protein BHE90_009084 [Fusarium euwallaceae]|uniref:INO80 complex subunit B-like conserved region domain-containing protein n=1 Tax=Fusarium euwallaceae TaxID=1147111 RepID=A0A430LL75_9HYPO|nr:hypothetical protein BHE90_009084 [Fusarium euwallaceae]